MKSFIIIFNILFLSFGNVLLSNIHHLHHHDDCCAHEIQECPECEIIKNNDNYISLSARLIDKFGDNGLISVIIGKVDKNSCKIETWLMSCRVLKRDLEFEFFNKFIEKCVEKGLKYVYGEYLATSKNKMVSNLYSDLG